MNRAESHYIVMGAGAVGGTLGALLHRSGRAVTLVARDRVARAIARQGGLRFIAAGREEMIPVEAVDDISRVVLRGAPTVFFTMKAGDLAPALPHARRALPAETLAVTWQNGIRAEAEAAPFFPDLLGGVVRATSTMLVPGEVRIRTPGLLIVGRHPPRAAAAGDAALDGVVADLRSAGFDAVPSPNITADKGLKLLLNLISGASPLVHQTGEPSPHLTQVEQAVLVEGERVLRAAGVPAHPASGHGDDVPTMLRRLASREVRPPALDQVHNSTWQNLATPGRVLENGYMNGEIVSLARKADTLAPWNARLLEVLKQAMADGRGPGALTDADLGRLFADLALPHELAGPVGG